METGMTRRNPRFHGDFILRLLWITHPQTPLEVDNPDNLSCDYPRKGLPISHGESPRSRQLSPRFPQTFPQTEPVIHKNRQLIHKRPQPRDALSHYPQMTGERGRIRHLRSGFSASLRGFSRGIARLDLLGFPP